jgi:dihydroorotate dehydrogenase electron transfer subunit
MKESDLHRNACVIENRPLCADHYLLVMREDELARLSQPGQFVNLKINNREELLLRRPFSIARTHPEGSLFEIVYRVVGKGTAAMKDLKPGDILDLMGPLGKGFHLPEGQKSCLLIGGGVGLAPLWGLADRLSQNGNRVVALLGFRSSDVIFGIDVFRGYGAEILVTTDDGSYGLKGFVSDHVEKVLKDPIDRVYVCGPPLMLKAVVSLLRVAGIEGEASVEEKMGCGYGVCLSCALDITKDGVVEKQRVCTEGPVFDLEELALDDET